MTKEANDIPFDLRGRLHIVHNGSITKVKEELPRHIEWAIAESSRGRSGSSLDLLRLILRRADQPLAESLPDHVPPIVILKAHSAPQALVNNQLRFTLANESNEVLDGIEYVSLLIEIAHGGLGWKEMIDGNWAKLINTGRTVKLGDKKLREVRLQHSIPRLPCGACDEFSILVETQGTPVGAEWSCILRLFCGWRIVDLPFGLKVQIEP